jgi:hypothetical protein
MAKPRQIKMEQKSALANMAALESKSDDELETETRYRAAAQAILGARAAERMDAKRAREHFRAALAASRPQERLQLRRMAEASLALAERRPDDLKAAAAKLGQPAPTGRQLFALRMMGIIAPPPGSHPLRRVGGVLLLLLAIVALMALGVLLVKAIAIPFGGLSTGLSFFWGSLLVLVVAVGFIIWGRRRQKRARARVAEQRAQMLSGGR